MGEGDHYQTLGLRRDASKADVKAAFSRLALLHHPDRHAKADAATRAEATRRFLQVYDAYHVLYDDLRRAEYDLRTSSSSASSGYGHGGAKSSSSAPSGYGHCGAKSSSSDPSGYGQHGDASCSASASDVYGHRHEHGGGFHNWPSPRGSESLGVWARANWFPLLCCAVRVARALIDVAKVLVDGWKLCDSWRRDRWRCRKGLQYHECDGHCSLVLWRHESRCCKTKLQRHAPQHCKTKPQLLVS